jgi:uncharacterized protein (TIGR03086 family)
MVGPTGAVNLLDRAVRYGLECVDEVAATHLRCPTPCADWDLRSLLLHVNDSVGALQEGIDTGCVSLLPQKPETAPQYVLRAADGDPAAALVGVFRSRTLLLLRTWTAAQRDGRRITVEGIPLAAGLVAITGAIEITVHGWDIAAACGHPKPIPARLAGEILILSPLVVGDGPLRSQLFAAPVAVSPQADPSEQLLAFLGRVPLDTPGH